MAEATTTTPAAKPASRKKQRRSVPAGQLHIQATFNNTIISFSDKRATLSQPAVLVPAVSVEAKKARHTPLKLLPKKPPK